MGRRRNRSARNRWRRDKNNTSKAESCFPRITLPAEIVVEILSRLPLSSLIQFTCVSKRWRSLINDICATKTGSPTVVLLSYSRALTFSPHLIDQHQQEIHTKSVYVPWKTTESDMDEFIDGFRILGSCNGLLLVSIGKDLFLWNPLTRFFKKVLAYFPLNDTDYGVCAGLCYDSAGGEYKAVLALSHQTPSYGGEFVVVGSFRSKSWTEIDFPYMASTVNSGPIVNGNLHWFASKNDSGSHFLSPHQIIYFNAHADKFEEVAMPDPRAEDGDIIFGLGNLDGYLCMSRSDSPGNSESNAEVLIMKEYGVKSSWSILFVVSDGRLTFNSYGTLVPLGYTKNGEVLTEVVLRNEPPESDWPMNAFYLAKNSQKIIPIPENQHFHVVAHEESLITPPDYGWEEEELKGVATYLEQDKVIYYGKRKRARMVTGRRIHRILKRNNMHEEPNSEKF